MSFDIAQLFGNNNKPDNDTLYHSSSLSALSSLLPYQQQQDKPRKRIRQRVDAGLPRSAYSKTSGRLSAASAMSVTDNVAPAGDKGGDNVAASLFNGNMAASYLANNYLQFFGRLQQQCRLPNPYQCKSADNDDDNVVDMKVDPDDKDENLEVDGALKDKETLAVDLSPEKQLGQDCDNDNVITDNEANDNAISPTASGSDSPLQTSFVSSEHNSNHVSRDNTFISKEIKELGDKLKSQLSESLADVVDKVISEYIEKEIMFNNQRHLAATASLCHQPPPPPTFPFFPFPPAAAPYQRFMSPFGPPAMLSHQPPPVFGHPASAIFPPMYKSAAMLACLSSLANNSNNNHSDNKSVTPNILDDPVITTPAAHSTPLSSIFGRKKRTKVTDSRISRTMLKHNLEDRKSASPVNTYRSAPYQLFNRDARSASIDNDNASFSRDEADAFDFMTPGHHTEFYYIQMEKYAKQFLAQGITSVDEIRVDFDCELYKTLVVHYSRNNNYVQVPTSFRHVVETTLREFFQALKSGRDLESSWKKVIYKIIARLDEPVPEYFKTANFLAQLG